jgi:hypothetical protein
LDLDAGDMILDKKCVRDLGRFSETISHSFDDQGLDLVCRDPIDGARLFRSALQEGRRDVVPVLDAAPSRMARCHSVASIVEDAA